MEVVDRESIVAKEKENQYKPDMDEHKTANRHRITESKVLRESEPFTTNRHKLRASNQTTLPKSSIHT